MVVRGSHKGREPGDLSGTGHEVTAEEDRAGGAAAVVADLASEAGWRDAATELVVSAQDGAGARALVRLATRWARPDADLDRDAARRARLAHLSGLVLALPGDERRRLRSTVYGMAAALGADRSLIDLQQRLRLGALDWRSPPEVRRALIEAVGKCSTRPLQAEALAGRLQDALEADPGAWEPEPLLRMAGELATRAGVAAPRLALAMAAVAGPRCGWDTPWLDLVESLRGHPEPVVALAAGSVPTPTG